ncbi:hypothetical protein ACRAWF_18185 [Streptomyces sp. L7]
MVNPPAKSPELRERPCVVPRGDNGRNRVCSIGCYALLHGGQLGKVHPPVAGSEPVDDSVHVGYQSPGPWLSGEVGVIGYPE